MDKCPTCHQEIDRFKLARESVYRMMQYIALSDVPVLEYLKSVGCNAITVCPGCESADFGVHKVSCSFQMRPPTHPLTADWNFPIEPIPPGTGPYVP